MRIRYLHIDGTKEYRAAVNDNWAVRNIVGDDSPLETAEFDTHEDAIQWAIAIFPPGTAKEVYRNES